MHLAGVTLEWFQKGPLLSHEGRTFLYVFML